jgi:single-strand DNA-binding protein
MVIDTNITTIIGRLTKDAEMKQAGLSVGYFTIASNRRKKDFNGSYVEEASFFDVNVYGKYAEAIIPKLKKGVQVSIVGSLKQERWRDQRTGQHKDRVVITTESIQILGGKYAQ